MANSTSIPKAAFVTPAILALGACAVVWILVRFWGANPEYIDRFLILAGSGWIAWQSRPELAALDIRPTRLGYVPLFFGAVSFPMGWFLQAQVGPKPVVLWWLAMAWLLAVAGAILVLGGWSHLRRLAFPLIFLLFALPIPNRILVPLQLGLQSATTAAATAVLPLLGIPVERSGFVLSLPSGDLGVAEACSGVRSVTALTAIAAFVAWWRGFGFIRGAMLVVLSVPIIAGVNAVRVIVSGLLQEHAGAEYVRGHWHEGLGVAMVLLGLALIVGLASLLTRVKGQDKAASVSSDSNSHGWRSSQFVTVMLLISSIATVAAQFLGRGVEEELVAAAPLEQIPLQIGKWNGADEPVPEEIASMLTADAIIRRVYRDPFGYEVHVWVMYWTSRNMVKGYHHPDVCWPNRGFRRLNRDVVPLAAGGGTLPVTLREFAHDSSRQLILYWTQEGKRIWTEEDEKRVQAAGDSHNWLEERLFRRDPPVTTGRIVVLIGTTTWGDGSTIRKQTLDFATMLGEEIYRVCPWAAPPGQ